MRLVATAGVTLDAGAVSGWRDLSGSSRAMAAQTNAARRPTILDNGLNGLPVVHFDGDDDYLALPFPATGRDKMTIAAVSRTWALQPGSPNNDCDFDKDGLTDVGRELNCSGTDQDLITWPEGGGKFAGTGIFYGLGQTEATFRFGTGQEYRHFKAVFVLDQPPRAQFVWSVAVLDGAARRFYINGKIPSGRLDYRDPLVARLETSAQQDESGKARPEWPVAVGPVEDVANIGRGRFEAPTSFWAGDLAELLIYESAFGDAELTALGAYVSRTYGIE